MERKESKKDETERIENVSRLGRRETKQVGTEGNYEGLDREKLVRMRRRETKKIGKERN